MTLLPTPILHHYPNSPFSEKIRLILGYKGISWQSVVIPLTTPQPDLVVLTGGHRKAPVLQIGADIYCDFSLIADVLEHMVPWPTLYPEPSKGMARILAQWADTTLFSTAMAFSTQPKGMEQLFEHAPPDAAKAFSEDCRAMSAGLALLPPEDAAAAYRSCLRRLSDTLDDRPFLLGDVPCITDFSVYAPLWFTRIRTSVLADILNATPAVLDWMDRMAALGHGPMEKFSASGAIAVAAASEPAMLHDDIFQDEHGIALGSRVEIRPLSVAPEPADGELIAATRLHYTLRRTDEKVGTVHVHFPRIGYVLQLASPA
jgi:glutathione S-transferase